MESPDRSKEQIDKFLKMLILYTKNLSLMMQEYKTIAGDEMSNRIVLGGFLQYEIKP